MAVICNKCGRHDDLCACGELEKEDARIVVRLEIRPLTKSHTIIEGIDVRQSDFLPNMSRNSIRALLLVEETVKDGSILLQQGDHRDNLKGYFIKMGFNEDAIRGQ
ncbi:MAG: stress response translation initiation inhibitor YciH [Nitrososphaera sp.]